MSDKLPPAAPSDLPQDRPTGWYDDPAAQFHYRWWEPAGWSTWVSHDDGTFTRPLPRRVSPRENSTVTFPATGVLWAFGGLVLAIVLSSFLLVGGDLVHDSLATRQVMGSIGLYGGTTLLAWFVSKRYGTGNIFRDLGIRIRKIDLVVGLGVAIAARALSITTSIAVLWATGTDDADPGQLDALKESDIALILAFTFAVFAAPLFEEIFFRGVIQRSFNGRWGPIVAITATSLLFGAVHLDPNNTAAINLILLASTATAGACFGFAYWATNRLGPAIMGHFFFNLAAVTVEAWDHFG